MVDVFGLNAGWATFSAGFNDAGLGAISQLLEKQMEQAGVEDLHHFVCQRIDSCSRYWAPEIRQCRMKVVAKQYALEIMHTMHMEMALELERRVKDRTSSWTHEKAEKFATEKAGKLLLALLGNLAQTN